MNHEMKLAKVPFDKIVSGSKTIESRLYDEKRKTIALNDTITFRLNDDTSRSVTKIVCALHVYPTFAALMNDLPAERFGWTSAADAIAEIGQFYSAEAQAESGVIGIGLE